MFSLSFYWFSFRLKGLCDNVDSEPENFQDHEICFSLRMPNQPVTISIQNPYKDHIVFIFRLIPIQNPLLLRVKKAHEADQSLPFQPYQLRYVGQPEIGDRTRPTLVRSSLDIACTPAIIEFLTELGCRVDYEYINRGFLFRKGRMKITVSKIFKVKPGDSFNEPISQSYLVELSVLAATGQEVIGDDMRIFAEQLKPLVQLDKIDFKRLGNLP